MGLLNKKEKAYVYKRSGIERVVFIIIFAIFLVYAITLIYPFIWAFISASKDNLSFVRNPLSLPEVWHLDNFAKAFEQIEFNDTTMLGMAFNSVWFSFGATFISVLVSSMTAYVVAKYDFKARGFVYGLAIFIMIIPLVGTLPSAYKLITTLKINNSPLILITFGGGLGFNFLLLHSFFRSLPWSYAEAAFIDGASDTKVFFSVMIPLARPTIVAVSIIQLIGVWNDYLTPILYLGDLQTLASGLYYFEETMKFRSNIPILFAGTLLSTIPVLLLFLIFRNTIMDNTSVGGLKG